MSLRFRASVITSETDDCLHIDRSIYSCGRPTDDAELSCAVYKTAQAPVSLLGPPHPPSFPPLRLKFTPSQIFDLIRLFVLSKQQLTPTKMTKGKGSGSGSSYYVVATPTSGGECPATMMIVVPLRAWQEDAHLFALVCVSFIQVSVVAVVEAASPAVPPSARTGPTQSTALPAAPRRTSTFAICAATLRRTPQVGTPVTLLARTLCSLACGHHREGGRRSSREKREAKRESLPRRLS
ncbi:hypothetical protein V8E36_000666 [Tilletia maclaganii]